MDITDDSGQFRYGGTRHRKYLRSGRRYRGKRNQGRQALREIRQVKKQLSKQVERKYKDGNISVSLVLNTPQYFSMTDIDQGDTGGTREGDVITLKSVTWRFVFMPNTAESDACGVRIALIYDRRPNGAQATWDEIYSPNSFTGLINMDREFLGRFQVLHDQTYSLNNQSQAFATSKGFIDLKGKEATYNATGGGIADQTRGNLFFVAYAVANDQSVSFSGDIRIRYTDM